MPNIKFNYLYRDGANYKKFNSLVFENSGSISLEDLEALIQSKLIYGEWFYADQWKLPEIFLYTFDFKTDPTWHEFESVEYCDEPANSAFTLAEFVGILRSLWPGTSALYSMRLLLHPAGRSSQWHGGEDCVKDWNGYRLVRNACRRMSVKPDPMIDRGHAQIFSTVYK